MESTMHKYSKKIKKEKLDKILIKVLQYTTLIVLAVILVFPYTYMILRSFMTSAQVMIRPVEFLPDGFSLIAWEDIFLKNDYFKHVLMTLKIIGFNVLAVPASASLVAYGFAKIKFKGSNFLFAIMLSTMMIPGVVTQIPLFVMFTQMGWINTILPLTIPNLFGGGAIYIFLIRQFMKGIPNEMDNAAKIDGANLFQRYSKITLPLCVPVLIFIMIGVFNTYWGDFYGPLLYMNKEGKETLAYAIFQDATYSDVSVAKENSRMAAGVFMSIFPSLLFLIFQKQLIEGVSIDGLKG